MGLGWGSKMSSGFFKVLLGRRAMRLWPLGTPSELTIRLFLRAEVLGKEAVDLGPFMVNTGKGPLWMKDGSWGLRSQPRQSGKLSAGGGSSERSKVALRSLTGRAMGVEQFCRAEGPRGTRLLMTVAGQIRGERQGVGDTDES